MSTTATLSTARTAPDFGAATIHSDLAVARLVELAIARGEGMLAANGALMCDTGARTGRSPDDKYLEDTPDIHGNIAWGKVNQPISPENFDRIHARVMEHMRSQKDLFRFNGYAGGDQKYRLKVSVFTQEAWHSLFAKTLFINAQPSELKDFKSDWTIINASKLELDDPSKYGVKNKLCIVQSLSRKLVLIVGTRYAGEMKKSIFYAMNYDLPDAGVFPMHCSANVAKDDDTNVAIFFGLSGTGKTTLSADPKRRLIGDDEHGWSPEGVFNIEGGCYAKCIKLSKAGEPQIWDAIRFGSVLENVDVDPTTREPDYDSDKRTENTRVTYPLEFVPDAVMPPLGKHPRNVIFLSADAFGVLPPVSKLTPEQAQYYFVNGYTSKLAGTEAGVKEPTPNFSACFGGPFMPREPMVYAAMLADRIKKHGSVVWLVNTGWTGGPYGVGHRFKLAYTRAILSAVLDGSLAKAKLVEHPILGLQMPTEVPGVPNDILDPRNTWADKAAYDERAKDLAKRFRDNDAKYKLSDAVRAAGPKAT